MCVNLNIRGDNMDFKRSDNKIWLEDENGKVIAEIDFPEVEEGVVNINHTEVDESLQGQGIASKLVKEVYQALKETNRKAVLSCSYAIRWFEKHEENQDVLYDIEEFKNQASALAGPACGIKKAS